VVGFNVHSLTLFHLHFRLLHGDVSSIGNGVVIYLVSLRFSP
jgi:hypothetical protein